VKSSRQAICSCSDAYIEIINPDREQNDTYINTNDIIPTNFPEYFESEDYLAIQKEMDRYHYEIVKSENIGKYIIIFNQKLIGILNDEMGIARSLKYQTFNSIEEAEKEVDFQLNKIYNNEKGTFGLVGAIKKSDFTEETNTLLNEIGEIRYDSEDYATGQRFMSENEISEIENGIKKLKELLNSVGKKIYEIGYINEK